MQLENDLFVTPGGEVIHKHTIEEVCAACGYDLTEEELKAAKCADCGADLNIKRSVSIDIGVVFGTGTAGL